MKRLFIVGLTLLSGCAGMSGGEEAPAVSEEETASQVMDVPTISDSDSHTLSVELTPYQGGAVGAREYVVIQAKHACDASGKALLIEDIVSETTWRGGTAQLTFSCVAKDDPRLQN